MQINPPVVEALATTKESSDLMKKLATTMSPAAFNVLQGLLVWADMWDTLHRKDDVSALYSPGDEPAAKLSAGSYATMLAPFGGFGNAPDWNTMSPVVSAIIVAEIMAWTNVPEYRQENTMTWCVLKSCAAPLALRTNGANAAAAAAQVVYEFRRRSAENVTNHERDRATN